MKQTAFQRRVSRMTRISCGDWLKNNLALLQGKSEFPYTETLVLLSFVMNKKKEWLLAHPEVSLSEEQEIQLGVNVNRLIEGEPLPYLTGIQAFYGLDFYVTPAVLIPRPETELLVEEAIQWLGAHPARRTAIDVGTGSGAIAVTLADQVPDLNLTAVDLSPNVLEVARTNAQKFGVSERIHFLESDLLDTVDGQFDLLAANLPYIPTSTLESLPVLKYEPRQALDGGPDGLCYIRKFLQQAVLHTKPGSLILLEIEASQGDLVLTLARDTFTGGTASLIQDYAKLPRIIKIQL